MAGIGGNQLLTMLKAVGEVATLHPNTPEATPIWGAFDSPFSEPHLGGMTLSTTKPQLTARTDDLGGVVQGDFIAIRGLLYAIHDLQEDGQGLTVIILERWIEI